MFQKFLAIMCSTSLRGCIGESEWLGVSLVSDGED